MKTTPHQPAALLAVAMISFLESSRAAPETAVFGEGMAPQSPVPEPLQPSELKLGSLEIVLPNKRSIPVDEKSIKQLQGKLMEQKAVYGVAPKIKYDLAKHEGEVTDIVNPRLPELEKLRLDLGNKFDPQFAPLLAEVTSSVEALDNKSREALRNTDVNAADQIASGFQSLTGDFLKLYSQLPPEAINERTRIAGQYALSKRSEKAWYGRDDNYRPEIYQLIRNRSRSCVGIFHRNGDLSSKPVGSGVLIGSNLILTADHVIEKAESAEDEFDVVFDYEEMREPGTGVLKRVDTVSRHRIVKVLYSCGQQGRRIDDFTTPADFALLEINPLNTLGKPIPSDVIPVSLDASTLSHETPIFLIGHPQQSPRMVHDNSWVKFPYRLSPRAFSDLLCKVNSEFIGAGGGSAAEQADAFLKAYRKQELPNGKSRYRYVAFRDGLKIDAIGIESDTFKGDSGAPAMLRETGDLIGPCRRLPKRQSIPAKTRLQMNSAS